MIAIKKATKLKVFVALSVTKNFYNFNRSMTHIRIKVKIIWVFMPMSDFQTEIVSSKYMIGTYLFALMYSVSCF